MACGGCMQARAQFVQSARRYDIRGAVSAIRRGVAVNVDKLRGTYDESQYSNVPKATPYRRPPERST